MTTTTRLHLPYPELSDAADVPIWVRNLAQLLDGITATFDWGLETNRPAAGQEGFFYYGTDSGVLTFDDGTALHPIGGTGAGTITRAMLHAQLKVVTGTAAPTDESIRSLGSGANEAAAGTDPGSRPIPRAVDPAWCRGIHRGPAAGHRHSRRAAPGRLF